MSSSTFFQVLSLVGAAMILGAYVGYQRGTMGRDNLSYNLLNFVGSGLLTWVAVIDRRWGFIVLEGSWALLSLVPILRPPTKQAVA
jgi:hypothetical protein